MTSVDVSVLIDATPEEVWEVVRHVGDHVDWMADAERIVFHGEQREGVGTSFLCHTKVGPIRLKDTMTITEWEDASVMAVRHEGIVTGEGRFLLEREGDRTRFRWNEDLDYPWYMGARVGEVVGGKLLASIWNRNLRELKAIIEARFPE